MYATTENPNQRAARRMITASFAAGIGAMVLVGLVAPVVAKGGLSLTNAEAHAIEQSAPIIEPLDVAAIEATLNAAEASMAAGDAATDAAIARLNRLTPR